MARTPAKDKVNTVSIQTIKRAGEMGLRLEQAGYVPKSYSYDGDGNIVSITCQKAGREQHITPELYESLTAGVRV